MEREALMMGRYTNRRQRDLIALLTLISDKVQEIGDDQLFGPGLANLKRGRSFIARGINEIGKTLDPGEIKRFENLARSCTIKIIEKTQPVDDMIRVSQEVVYTLAEMAITNHCVGCQLHEWKTCKLQQTLSDAWIPQAGDDTRKECRFSQ